jgi:hypothetical protein
VEYKRYKKQRIGMKDQISIMNFSKLLIGSQMKEQIYKTIVTIISVDLQPYLFIKDSEFKKFMDIK